MLKKFNYLKIIIILFRLLPVCGEKKIVVSSPNLDKNGFVLN